MAGFFKKIGQAGLIGASTLAGGPAAGAAAAGGLGMLKGLKEGGTLGDMLMGGATGAGGAYLGGQLATPTVGAISPTVDVSPAINASFNPATGQLENKSLLDALKFNY